MATEAVKTNICNEIIKIMEIYHAQEETSWGVDTPGGLEHMGDVWKLFLDWEKELLEQISGETIMNLKIFEEKEKEETILLFLKLREETDGNIVLSVVDSIDNVQTNLLYFENQELHLCLNVKDTLGFKLGCEAKLQVF